MALSSAAGISQAAAAQSAAQPALPADGVGRHLPGFRIARLAADGLVLERATGRYLTRVVAGSTAGLRVGARIRLALDGPLPQAAASPAVRGRIVTQHGRPTETILELRFHGGPRPTVKLQPGGPPPQPPSPPASAVSGRPSGLPISAAGQPGPGVAATQSGMDGLLIPSSRQSGGVMQAIDVPVRVEPFRACITCTAWPSANPPPDSTAIGDKSLPHASASLAPGGSSPTANSAAGLASAIFRLPLLAAPQALRADADDLAALWLKALLSRAAQNTAAGLAALTAEPTPEPAALGSEPRPGAPTVNGCSTWVLGAPEDTPARLTLAIATDDNRESDAASADRCFHIVLDLSHLGRIRLELACIGTSRHLTLRSEHPLSADCLHEIADLFGAALAIAGRSGQFVAGRLASKDLRLAAREADSHAIGFWV